MHNVGPGDDVFELLLSRGSEGEAARARRVSTFLRLLMHDAGDAQAEVVGAGLLDARAALDAVTRDDLSSCLQDLLVHYLAAVRGADSFLELPAPKQDLESAWGVLIERRAHAHSATGFEVPGLPSPGELPAATLKRLYRALSGLGGDGELWQARVCHALEGPHAAEELLLSMLTQNSGTAQRRSLTLQALAAARLDRGRPASAASLLLEESLEMVSASPVLARQAVWALAFLGRDEEAANLAPGFLERGARLPLGVVELIARRPELRALLAGKLPGGSPQGLTSQGLPEGELNRGSLGASVLLWIRLGPAHTPELIVSDVAPDLRGRLVAWLRGRDGAAGRIGAPEQRLLSTAAPVLLQRGSESLTGVLDPERSRSLALVPALDPRGEVVGWMHVECAHHLLPSSLRLAAARDELSRRAQTESARAPRIDGVGDRSGSISVHVQEASVSFGNSPATPSTPSGGERAEEQAGILASAARAAVEGLGLRLARRRWCWFDVLPTRVDRVHRVGQGKIALIAIAEGGYVGLRVPNMEVHRAAQRALNTAAPVVFGESAKDLARSPRARSGLALPLMVGTRVIAVLCLESTRAGDLDEAAAARILPPFKAAGPDWRAARFRAWHLQHFKQDVVVDLRGRAWNAIAGDAERLVRLHTPLSIIGPRGAGKTILARWLHFQRSPLAADLHTWHGGLDQAESLELGRRVGPGCLVVEDLGGVSRQGAARALACVGAALEGGAQVIGLAQRVTEPSSFESAELWERFGRVVLRVPALCDRRDELAEMSRQLLANACEEEGLEHCRPTDSALALVWRQPWPGNVRELEAFLYKLAALGDGEVLEETAVEAVAQRFGLDLVRRLPSRHPRREYLEAALWLTAKKSGAWNKTRAALYLGWDPDTLVRRMGDLGIAMDRPQVAEPDPS